MEYAQDIRLLYNRNRRSPGGERIARLPRGKPRESEREDPENEAAREGSPPRLAAGGRIPDSPYSVISHLFLPPPKLFFSTQRGSGPGEGGMKIKKNFLSRIARRKGAAQAESEEGHGIPPPAAIEPFVPDATGIPKDKELGSHRELELVASGEPAPAGSADGADAVDGGDAPAPEALSELPRGAAPYEEYGLELELLSGTESEASPEEPNLSPDGSSLGEEAAASAAAGSVVQASAPEPVHEEDESVSLVSESAADAVAPEPEVIRESEPEAADDAVAGDGRA